VRTFFSDLAGGGKYPQSAIRNPQSAIRNPQSAFGCGRQAALANFLFHLTLPIPATTPKLTKIHAPWNPSINA
jgi:hypothetical protein